MARNNIHQFVAKRKAAKTEQLWNEYVGEVLSMGLAAELSEPLDSPQFDDVPDDVKQTMREVF